MSRLQPVRGTHDLLPDDYRRHRHVVDLGRRIAERYGYAEMATPIFEFSDVFKRTLGEASDIVSKEMYTFVDKGGDEITLRPEGTAGIARAVISGGLQQNLPLKLYYSGPMFRYERPQKGRQRQFHQIGVELLGVPEPEGDVETITLGARILAELGVLDKTTLEINSLGDAPSRAAYRQALVDYLSAHAPRLSEDSKARLQRNPLRILDSKDAGDRTIIADAPPFSAFLNDGSKAFFNAVCDGLAALGIAFTCNERLVRGLDYYCHTAFEFTTLALGAQGTVLAGGRYDGLVEMMGGAATPGVGWAAGIERLALLAGDAPPAPRPIAVVPIGEAAERRAMVLTETLRRAGLSVDLAYRGNLARRMKRANRVNARYAVIFGDDELGRGSAMLRDLDQGAQEEVSLDALIGRLGP
ncbi:MAG: histidine--tRNA ligase [Alphaproteobacteria bacterium]